MKDKTNIILAIVITSTILGSGVYLFLYTKLLNNELEVLALHSKLNEEERELSDFEKNEKNLDTTIIKSDKLNILFVKPDAVVDFIQKVESVFKVAGVYGEVSSVSEEKFSTSSIGEQGRLLVTLNAGGDWNGLIKLVGLLERLPYRSTVQGLNLISNKSDKVSANSKDVVTTKEWGLKVRMHVWLTPVKNNNPEMETQINEE